MDFVAYVNGRFLPYAETGLAWHDAGFVYGATATDFVRTFQQRLFRLEDHVERFELSCRRCQIPLELCSEDIVAVATELATRNRSLVASELGLMMFATPGPLGRFTGTFDDGPPTLAMHMFALPTDRYRRLYQSGARLIVPDVAQVNPEAMDRNAKHRSRLHYWTAIRQARALEDDAEPILLDSDGYVTETPTANLIVAKDGELFTPKNCLPGVSLKVIEELVTVHEADLTIEHCEKADELILTSTGFCIAGVSAFQNLPVAWPGPVLRKLQSDYIRIAGSDFSK